MNITLLVLFFLFSSSLHAANPINDLAIEMLGLVDALNALRDSFASGKLLPIVTPAKPLTPLISTVPGSPALLTGPWIAQSGDLAQIRVLQQGADAYCGYHALKNAILLLNAFKAGSNNAVRKLFIDQLTQKDLFQRWLNDWGGSILAARMKTGAGNLNKDWLNGVEIENLIKGKVPENYEHSSDSITVIDNPDWLSVSSQQLGQGITKDMVKAITDFQKQDNYQHAFIIANSKEYQNEQGFIAGTWTHWLTVGVNKVNGKVQFIIADSLNTPRLNSDEVKVLVNTLKNADLITLAIRTSDVIARLDSIASYERYVKGEFPEYAGDINSAYEGAISAAQQIVASATKNGWFLLSQFAPYKEELNDALKYLFKTLFDPSKIVLFTDYETKKNDIQQLLNQLQ